jgi:Amt family ammonium transporter
MDPSLNTPDLQEALTGLMDFATKAGLALPGVPFLPEQGAGTSAPPKGTAWEPYLRYRSLVEKLPVVTFMIGLDAEMQEMYVSPQIEAMLGFTQEEWLADPILWYQQLHPDDRETWVAEFARTCAVGKQFRAEYRMMTRTGEPVWVQGDCQVIRDETDGRPLFLQGIAFDITHLKRAAQVEEDKRAAEAANSAKSEFLARMSHEIRTPLNGVVGMIDLLRATGMTELQRRYASLARDAADALMDVINDILDFSKIEAGKVEIESIEFDLHKVIEDLTELLAPVAGKKNLALNCCLRSDVPRKMTGDPNRIRQVLTNLVGNAIKFTPRGNVNIRAVLDHRDDHRFVVRVRVEDTGIGIPPDRLDRLFKSFSQVDSSTTRKFGGTGLGLAISKRLVELMGGEIGIESIEGHGTTFWFTLVLGAVAGADDANSHDAPAAPLRVLAIEPDSCGRSILAEQMRGIASASSEVVGPDEAIAQLRIAAAAGERFGLLLLPHRGPETERLKNAIRSDPALRATKLVAVMNLNEAVDSSMLAAEGFFSGLCRPITQSCLSNILTVATVPAQTATAPAAQDESNHSISGLHVLVAEDNEMNQFVTRETLSGAGCTCDVAGDGIAAVEASQHRKYDAILMDCQMPHMDGLEASRRIRELEASGNLRRVPIIALTAEAIQGDREKCLAAGMDGYVTKPLNPKELFAAIANLVFADRTASAADVPVPAGDPLDTGELLVRCMRDAAFATKTLEKFGRRAVDDIEKLRGAVAARDASAAAKLAHNLKAVAAHVSANEFNRIAFEIEQAGLRSDLAAVEQQLAVLDREVRRCVSFIPHAIESIRQAPATK